ncbi:MAG: response regulator [Gammaproteobacteria bacterium]|nr:response regulator [Gammaproteobacteria bacterium]HJP03592.1 response regulator [Gammaproteobacteria bacterium]
MSERQTAPVKILLVEDDSIDVKAFQRAMGKLKISNPIIIKRDGQEAWEFLQECAANGGEDAPSLVILDINMPRMSGLELLTNVRANDQLRHLIVFVLTTSNDEQDKFEAFNMNVAGYMLKSDMGNSFIRAVELIDSYWRVVEFPEPHFAPVEPALAE